MRIIRVRHQAHYTMIHNQTLRDASLSFKARGLLAYLLSLPDQTRVSREDLANYGTEGEYAIRTALQELVKAGYIEHERVQNNHGQWVTETVVRECPAAATEGRKSPFGARDYPHAKIALSNTEVPKDKTPAPACGTCGEPAFLNVGGTNFCTPCYERFDHYLRTGDIGPALDDLAKPRLALAERR